MRSSFMVFLSYARPDAMRARAAFSRLRQAGFDVWMDIESIRAGEEWELAIERALRHCHVVLILFSERSVTRDGFLQREIHAALDHWKCKAPGRVYLIPARLEECGRHERLSRLQWIDLFDEAGWERLLAQLHELSGDARASAWVSGVL